MKRTVLGLLITTIVVPCGFNGLVASAQAQTSLAVDIGFFYERLAPYGDWREHPRWGWVWSPRGVPVDWRPYTLGHWVYTDDFGWLWESDEEWGWACYHYGRWDWDNQFGWFWVPSSYWGPAWVAWRTSPGYVGWCPLPPPVLWRPGAGLDFGGFDLDDIPPWEWIFVEVTFFDAPRLHDRLLLVSRNEFLLRETRPIVRFETIDGRIVNRAFSDRDIERFAHHRVEHFRVRHVDSPSAMHVFRGRDGEIAVFNPRIGRGRAGLTPPGSGEWERRQRTERAQLQERQRAEQSRQEERQRTERPTPGARTEQLQRQHEAERQALQGEHERQRQALENRHTREREEFGSRQARPNAPGGPGRVAGAPEEQRGREMRR